MKQKIAAWLRANRLALPSIAAAFALDRLTKEIALRTIAVSGPAEIWPCFSFTYAENTGAAFSIFKDGNFLLIFVTIAIMAFMVTIWKETARIKPWGEFGLSLIFGGALGNLYDRILLGYVVDFLDFKVWPVFNLADSFICVGAGILLIAALLEKKGVKK